ncbi:MAG: chaperone modulator CbpM [Gammaproteobacteria bacterium]|nr:chaperone modulator CbpM [Gammaproteobacteria bacterium]MDH4314500.1 chaperone modulator CbpM [Gammaproteobacteria bacterium]MDH5215380.1 chaperone modulator CbpM [Gammaproteobacteria bacterium]
MPAERSDYLRGLVLDREARFTLREICRAVDADRDFVQALVAEGVIDPLDDSGDWHFHGEALMRACRAQRLMRDLDINLQGAALVLDLLDELERLRQDVSSMSR